MPATSSLERYCDAAGYLNLAYMFVQCPAEHAKIAYVFAARPLVDLGSRTRFLTPIVRRHENATNAPPHRVTMAPCPIST